MEKTAGALMKLCFYEKIRYSHICRVLMHWTTGEQMRFRSSQCDTSSATCPHATCHNNQNTGGVLGVTQISLL
jgi:hypothetical protein